MPERLSNRREKNIRKLSRRKHRRAEAQTLVEGVRAVEAALDASAPLVCLVAAESAMEQNRRLAALVRRAEEREIPAYVTSAETLGAISDVPSPQGVLAVARTDFASLDALAQTPAVLVLDGVQDPGNVGTALRTAAWFGAGGVLAGPGTAGLYGPKTVRAGMGAHWSLPLARTRDLPEALGQLRRAGFALYGASGHAGTPAPAWAPRRPSALVLGSEAHGLSTGVLDLVGERVTLPAAPGEATLPGGVESLNVAVAGGILVYEWLG